MARSICPIIGHTVSPRSAHDSGVPSPGLIPPLSFPESTPGSELGNRYHGAVETGLRTHAIAIGIFCVIVSMALFLSHPIPFAIGFLAATLTPILIRNLPERVGATWKNNLDLIRGCVLATSLATCPVSLAATVFFGGAGLSLCTQ